MARVVKAGGGETPADTLNDAVEVAEDMLTEGQADDAAQTFSAILGEDPNHAGAYGGLVRSHIALGDLDQAEAVLNGALQRFLPAQSLNRLQPTGTCTPSCGCWPCR